MGLWFAFFIFSLYWNYNSGHFFYADIFYSNSLNDVKYFAHMGMPSFIKLNSCYWTVRLFPMFKIEHFVDKTIFSSLIIFFGQINRSRITKSIGIHILRPFRKDMQIYTTMNSVSSLNSIWDFSFSDSFTNLIFISIFGVGKFGTGEIVFLLLCLSLITN